MKWDHAIDGVLKKLGHRLGLYLHFHSQNLTDEGRQGRPMTWPYHGRCWLHVGKDEDSRNTTLGFSWNLWSRFCGVDLSAGGEHTLEGFVGLPPVSLWWHIESWELGKKLPEWMRYEPHDLVSIRIHDAAIWWSFVHSSHCWSNKTPKWRNGNWHPGDLLGKRIFKEELIEERDVEVHLPEGAYPAHIKLVWATRGRQYGPQRTDREARVNLEKPIPYSGKGENAWDCGKDGLWGWSGGAQSIHDAIAKTVQKVVETRLKRGDPQKWDEAA